MKNLLQNEWFKDILADTSKQTKQARLMLCAGRMMEIPGRGCESRLPATPITSFPLTNYPDPGVLKNLYNNVTTSNDTVLLWTMYQHT